MPEQCCPKCGAAFKYIASGAATFRCGSSRWYEETGERISQTHRCQVTELEARIRELTAEVGRLTKEAAILREAIGELWLMPAKEEQQATGDELVDRLRGIYTVPVNDGAGPLNGKDTFTQCFNVAAIKHRAADEIERLREELADYRKGAAAEAAAGDEAVSPTGQQRCYKCNQWIFSYPCMYCGR